jgi:hypothetical protein
MHHASTLVPTANVADDAVVVVATAAAGAAALNFATDGGALLACVKAN